MSLDSQVDRGLAAQRILNDPLVQDAFKTVAEGLHVAWAECPVRDLEGQHELKLMLKLLSDVRQYFEIALSEGESAAQTIKAREESKKGYSPAQWKREYYGY